MTPNRIHASLSTTIQISYIYKMPVIPGVHRPLKPICGLLVKNPIVLTNIFTNCCSWPKKYDEPVHFWFPHFKDHFQCCRWHLFAVR